MEQLEPLLRELAAQLGTTVEFLWGVLVKQAIVTAWRDLIFSIGYFPMSAWVSYKLWNLLESDEEDLMPIYAFVLFIVFIFTIIIFTTVTYTIPERLINPEYWALQQILEQLK